MGPKTHNKPFHTPSAGTLTCKLCGKQGLAYQCGFCEKFRTCGECGQCNEKSCGCETKVVRPVDKAKGHEVTARAVRGVGMSPAMPALAVMEDKDQRPSEVPKSRAAKAVGQEASESPQAEKMEEKKRAAVREMSKKEKTKPTAMDGMQNVDTPKPTSSANPKPDTMGKLPASTSTKSSPLTQTPAKSNGKAVSVDQPSASKSPKPISKSQTTQIVTQALENVDLSAIAMASGDLTALIKALGNHFKAQSVPHIAIATPPTEKTLGTPYDLASNKLRFALAKAVEATPAHQVTNMYCKMMNALIYEQKKSETAQGTGLALMVMTQAVALAWPAEVAAAASHAAKIHGDYRNQLASITVMWMMGQTWHSSTPCAVEAWQQHLAPLFWAKNPDQAVYQYGEQYTSLMTNEKLRGERGGGIAMDILSLCRKQHGEGRTAGSEGCQFLGTKMDYFVNVWLEYATQQQMEVVFHKIINEFDKASQPSLYYDTLSKVACGALAAHPEIFQNWGQTAIQLASGDVKAYASYMAGSEHFVQKMGKTSPTPQLPPALLNKAYIQLAASGNSNWNEKGKGEEKNRDSDKIEEAVTYFETMAAPSRGVSWLWPLLLVVMLLVCLVFKINDHCLEHPCGPHRPCDSFAHPCRVVRAPVVAGVLDNARTRFGYYQKAGARAAQPLMPVINTGRKHVTNVAEKAQAYWKYHCVPFIEVTKLYASPAGKSMARGYVWAQANVMPPVKRAMVVLQPHLDTAMAWIDSHVVTPGMPYGTAALVWFNNTLIPRMEKLANQTLILTQKSSEAAVNDWLPQANSLAGQIWTRVRVYTDMIAIVSAEWWQTIGQPATVQVINKGQQAVTTSAEWWQNTGQPAANEMMKKGQQAATESGEWWQKTGLPAAKEMMKKGQQMLLIGKSRMEGGLAKVSPYVQSTVMPAAKEMWKDNEGRFAQAKVWAKERWAKVRKEKKAAKAQRKRKGAKARQTQHQ